MEYSFLLLLSLQQSEMPAMAKNINDDLILERLKKADEKVAQNLYDLASSY